MSLPFNYLSQSWDILKKTQKFETIFLLLWRLLSKRQINWMIDSNFVAILEKLNFNTNLKNKATEAIIATRFDHCILFTDRQDPKMRKKNVKNI